MRITMSTFSRLLCGASMFSHMHTCIQRIIIYCHWYMYINYVMVIIMSVCMHVSLIMKSMQHWQATLYIYSCCAGPALEAVDIHVYTLLSVLTAS